jgi:hypothetical protein
VLKAPGRFWWLTMSGRRTKQRIEIGLRYLEAAQLARNTIIMYCLHPFRSISDVLENMILQTRLYVAAGFEEIEFADIVRLGDGTQSMDLLRPLLFQERGEPAPKQLDIEKFFDEYCRDVVISTVLVARLSAYLHKVLPAQEYDYLLDRVSKGGGVAQDASEKATALA